MISVIIPIYDEEKILSENSVYFRNLSQKAELIFVDGGSVDRSAQIAGSFGRVVLAEKGRAVQMNYGASLAGKDIILFLHADTCVSPEALSSIEEKITGCGFVGGCLTQRINNESFIYRLIEAQGNSRAKLTKVFYGDQGIFVKKDVFLAAGGFPEVPILEDVIFTRKLRSQGKTVVLGDKIVVSSRRWEKRGIISTFLLYSLILILFRLSIPLEKIKMIYDDLR